MPLPAGCLLAQEGLASGLLSPTCSSGLALAAARSQFLMLKILDSAIVPDLERPAESADAPWIVASHRERRFRFRQKRFFQRSAAPGRRYRTPTYFSRNPI